MAKASKLRRALLLAYSSSPKSVRDADLPNGDTNDGGDSGGDNDRSDGGDEFHSQRGQNWDRRRAAEVEALKKVRFPSFLLLNY